MCLVSFPVLLDSLGMRQVVPKPCHYCSWLNHFFFHPSLLPLFLHPFLPFFSLLSPPPPPPSPFLLFLFPLLPLSLFLTLSAYIAEEEPIMFPPTYRYAKGRRSLDDYVWVKQKRSGVRKVECRHSQVEPQIYITLLSLPPMQIRINVPSYCDRVLWRSYPGTNISNTSYGNLTIDL